VKKPGRARFSAQEKTILGLVAGASLLIWAALISTLVVTQTRPSTALGIAAVGTASPIHARRFVLTASPTPSPPHAPARQATFAQSATDTPDAPQPEAPFTPRPMPGRQPLPTQTVEPSTIVGDETAVIALLGIDKPRQAKIWRTDSIVLVLVNERNQRAGIVSIPRDLWVLVPGHGYARVNTVDALGERTDHPGGGPRLLDQTLRHNLDIPVDHYARIDFRGFEDLIDEVGGVTIDVEAPLDDRFPDPLHPSGWTRLTLSAGRQHMDGHTALNYCRSRTTTSDFDRSRRQRKVIVALWTEMLTLDTLVRAPRLWKGLSDTFETDLSMAEAVRLAYVIYGIGIENVRTMELGPDMTTGWVAPGGAQVLLPKTGAIQDAIHELISTTE
jgi:LCP family protein required for cell wall assembly